MMFAGILARKSGTDLRGMITDERLTGLLDPFGQAGGTGTWHGDSAVLAQTQTNREVRHRAPDLPERCPATGALLVGWCRLDNRDKLARRLGADCGNSTSDAQLIMAAHREWGTDAPRELLGDFAYALYSPADGSLFLAKDPLGTRPLFYMQSENVLAFASSAAVFPALKGVSVTPSQEWIGRYLTCYPFARETSPFEEIRKIAPAHCAHVPEGEPVVPQRYFSFDPSLASDERSDETLIAGYREQLDKAIDDRLPESGPFGVESSGGLDSSSILARAAEMTLDKDRLHTFGLCALADEPALLLETGLLHGVRHNHICTERIDNRLLEYQTRSRAMMGFPAEHMMVDTFSIFMEQASQMGIDVMLSGYGGDEGVTSQAHTPGNSGQQSALPLRSIRQRIRRGLSGFIMSSRPPAAVTISANAAPRQVALAVLDPDFVGEFRLDEFPTTHHTEQSASVNETIVKRLECADVNGRLEAYTLAAAAYGIEYRWPLLDRRLVETFLAAPDRLKRQNGIGRYIHRRANADRLPKALTWHAKYMGNPLGGYEQQFRHQDIDPNLLSNKLTDIVDLSRLEKARQDAHSIVEQRNAGRFAFLRYYRQLDRRLMEVSRWLESSGT